jgi:L-lactate dehydrogenase complex protein LldG
LLQRLTEAGASLAQADGLAQLAQAISQHAGAALVLEDHPWLQAAAAHFPAALSREILFMANFSFNPLSPRVERVRVRGETDNNFDQEKMPKSGHPNLDFVDTVVTIGLGAVPETGSVLLSSRSPQAFRLSLCPCRHIVVIPADQASLTMAEALALTGREPCGLVSWITGPSRTADIEKVLVLGAQGASELSVIIYQEE